LRLIGYKDSQTGKIYQFLTNNVTLWAATIAQIYKSCWEIELFFKWIKQNLKMTSFFGTSKHAVLSQIWIAMIYFLLLSYIKHQTKYRGSLLTLASVFQETLFHRNSIIDILGLKAPDFSAAFSKQYQLSLF
jgi:IS4 transposase